MRRIVLALLLLLLLGLSGTALSIAGDIGPDGNGAVPYHSQWAGDIGPDGNG